MFTKRGGGGFGPRTRVGPVWAQAAGPRAGVGTRRPRLPSWWCRGGGPLCRSTARLMQPQEPSGRSRGPGGARSPGSDCRPCAQQSGEGGATRPGGGPAPSGGVLCTERARVALPRGQGAGSGHGRVRRGHGSCDRPRPHPELPRPSDTWPGRRLVPLSPRPLRSAVFSERSGEAPRDRGAVTVDVHGSGSRQARVSKGDSQETRPGPGAGGGARGRCAPRRAGLGTAPGDATGRSWLERA